MGSTYGEVLKKLQKDLPAEISAGVRGARRTKAGNLVIEMNRDADGRRYTEAANSIVGGDRAKVTRKSLAVVEVKGLDEEAGEDQVKEAIDRATEGKGCYEIRRIRQYRGDLRIAMVECSRVDARALLELRTLRLGWMSCRLQERQQKPVGCGRCLGYGHYAENCKGEDRRDHCRRCNGKGHFEKECEQEPKCVGCMDLGESTTNHFRGSKGCRAFREAQDKMEGAATKS